MLMRLPFTKTIFLLIIAFINYSCFSYQNISIEEITKKDFVKDLKIILYDGSIYKLYTNEYVIDNNLLHIIGSNARTISLSQIKSYKVNEFSTANTIVGLAVVGLVILIFYLGVHNMSLLGDGPIM